MIPLAAALAVGQVLTLQQAVATAERNAPQLHQLAAQTEAAHAREGEARAPLLPQITGTATYSRATANFVARPGSLPKGVGTTSSTSSWDSFNFFSAQLQASQLLWDFGQQWHRYRAAEATTEAQRDNERNGLLTVIATVRTAFFNARAQRDLVGVAQANLANQQRHLEQIEGFVRVGTRPEIDLAQAKTDRANAKLQLIQAENAYATAKAQLNQAMGVERDTDYDVETPPSNVLSGEDQPLTPLLDEALRARPDMAALEQQIRAQQYLVSSAKGAYGPSLAANATLSDAGPAVDETAWNAGVNVTLTWDMFQGLLTWSTVKENEALLEGLQAQRDLLRQQVRLDVEQARLAVRADKEAVLAADEAVENAQERLHLAEGRYQAGVGNVIELGDAQVAYNQAAANRVQAEFNLAAARSQLARVLGRE